LWFWQSNFSCRSLRLLGKVCDIHHSDISLLIEPMYFFVRDVDHLIFLMGQWMSRHPKTVPQREKFAGIGVEW
jgi:hypothetical protein